MNIPRKFGLPGAGARFPSALTILLLITAMIFNVIPAGAQIPAIPSTPNNDDVITTNNQPSFPATVTPTPPPNLLPPSVQITSVEDGQQIPAGVITIEGISSDDQESDCQVYADANDITPMRNVTAVGDSEEDNDFSQWTFTYTQDYQLIKQGENELTAKISCYAAGNPTPLSEWHTVNVTGVAAGQPLTGPADGELASEPDEEEGEEGEDETPLFS